MKGSVLRDAFISAANNISNHKQKVNALNVFPVPDGDTGTNMSMTISAAKREVQLMDSKATVAEVSKTAASALLRGARGNSGVILSQILKGFSSVVVSEKTIDTKTFAKALKEGANVAYKAVTIPKEGTILTVIRMMADESIKIAKKQDDMVDFLKATIDVGEEVLKMTPDLLPVLKKAGVVDAGGRGLLVILNGFLKVLMGDESELTMDFGEDTITENPMQNAVVDYNDLADIEFAYCTEFFVININKKTTEADIDKLREKLMSIGDSVICIGDLNLIKVHVHTNDPGIALSSALKLGEINGVKIENMLEQNRQLKIQSQPVELKPIGTVSVCVGDGMVALFKDLNVDHVIEGGQTMNPSAEDIAKACDQVAAETVFVFPNNKNIIPAAELANDLSKRNIIVIPTTSVPQGISAVIALNTEINVEENKNNILEAMGQVKTGSVTFAVKSTNIDGFKLKEGDIIGLGEKQIVAKGADVNEVCEKTVEKLVTDESMMITLFYGKEVQEAEANALAEKLAEKYPDLEVDVHMGGQPLYYYLISVE